MVLHIVLERRRQHTATIASELDGHGHRKVWLPATLNDGDAYSSMRNSEIVIASHGICALGVCCGAEARFRTLAQMRNSS